MIGDKIQIIVVDDEPIGADELSEMIHSEFGERKGVQVRTAYHAATVLEMVKTQPCDILVSDIQMHGMTGLQLVSTLRAQYPDMRVLFLTGHDDFSFAYEAFRQNAAHYLLKTEGDDAILRAVEEEIDQVRERERIIERIRSAEGRYTQMIPAYRRQLLMQSLFETVSEDVESDLERVVSGNLYIVVARPSEAEKTTMRLKLIASSAVKQIIENALGDALYWSESFLQDSEFIWVFAADGAAQYTHSLFQLMRKARKYLEEQLSLTLFFIVSEESVQWRQIGGKYAEIRGMLSREILRGAAGVAIRHPKQEQFSLSAEQTQQMNALRRQVEYCQKDLRGGSPELLQKRAQPILDYLIDHQASGDAFALELKSTLQASIISYANVNGLSAVLSEMHAHENPVEALQAMIGAVMSTSQKQMDWAVKSIAQYIIEYIQEHLSENISTAVLAEKSGYSAGYLSRVFKQEQGMSIHEYITQTRIDMAKELLRNTNLRVYEIASSCGYDNTTYFIKIFKNATGQTPQEFKQNALKRSGRLS